MKSIKEVELEKFTPTFSMLLKHHLREEAQIILISNAVNDSLTNDMTQAHANRDSFANKKNEMFEKAKSKAAEVVMK